jgi:hypothetical protein
MRIELALALAAAALTPEAVFANQTAPGGIQVQPINDEDFRLEDLTAGEEKHRARTTTTFEGAVSLVNRFTDDDLFVQIDRPAVESVVTLQLTPEFGLYLSSVNSLDRSDRTGDEFFVTAFYTVNLSDEAVVEFNIGRSFNTGFNDIWVLTAGVEYNDFDLSATQFVVDNGPRRQPGDGEDATRLQFGYTPELIDGVISRAFVTYETGFGFSDIVTAGVEIEVPLGDTWSLRSEFLVPLIKAELDDRKPAFMVGVTYTF